jgi:hypothetical protein
VKWPLAEKKPEADLKGLAGRGDLKVSNWIVKFNGLSIPVVELAQVESPKSTVLVVCDAGRAGSLAQSEELLKAGHRVIAADLYYFGECHPPSHDYLWSLMLATVGDRAIGMQAAQLDAVARWAGEQFKEKGGVKAVAIGPRTSTIALVAAALKTDAIAALELHDPLGSFQEIVEENRVFAKTPELFCFGLLAHEPVELAALVAPRLVVVRKPSDRARKEFAPLAGWYKTLGEEFDPLK